MSVRRQQFGRRDHANHSIYLGGGLGSAPHRGPLGVLPGRQWGVTRQTLLLDVKEALVDEFVDAEGA
jgi:hypothetical protein